MNNLIIARMIERAERSQDLSDAAYFDELMLLGELLLKLTTSYLIAGLSNGKQRGRYRAEYKIMHSNGLGVWAEVLEEILSGTLSTHIIHDCSLYTTEITKRIEDKNCWQYEACTKLEKIFSDLEIKVDTTTKKTLRSWFKNFVFLRNKIKGHGAYQKGTISLITKDFNDSIFLIINNLSLINVDSAHIYLNLNKKYRVTKITNPCSNFDFIKDTKHDRRILPDGPYVFYDKLRRVNLLLTDQDLADVFFPNGKNASTCETMSYLTGKKKNVPLDDFTTPPDDLPRSETYGLDGLDIYGNFFSNVPNIKPSYIIREQLEEEIKETLLGSRHSVITLSGRGGIGKTSTIVSILHGIMGLEETTLEVALWFSSRDIDLMDYGPKPVRMAVSTKDDICNQYISLMAPETKFKTSKEKMDFFLEELRIPYGEKGKILVFDNFETLSEPEEIFNWLNAQIRPPNKIVITTRFRSFKGDYPIEVKGMNKEESFQLIETHSRALDIVSFIDEKYKLDIYEWSEGHPYIIKVLLGQVANKKKKQTPQFAFSANEDILNALFERTYNILTPTAVRIYLTLCKWNSDIPEIAIKAVLARPTRAISDITEAINELINFSMIESFETGGRVILTCPVASRLFGERKLKVSPEQFAISQDVEILMTLGASQQAGQYSFDSKIASMVKAMLRYSEAKKISSEDVEGIIDYLSSGYPRTSFIAGSLFRFIDPEFSSKLYSKFLETAPDVSEEDFYSAWEGIADCSKALESGVDFINAKAQIALRLLDKNFENASFQLNIINKHIADNQQQFQLNRENKVAILSHLADKMAENIGEFATADDCSRIAWLFLNCGQKDKALETVDKGLELSPGNVHCINIKDRLQTYN